MPAPRSHSETLQSDDTESIDPAVDAAASNLYLETLIEREWTETLAMDALTRSGQPRDLKKNKRRISNLTFKSRIPGETWRDVGECG